MLSLAVFGQPDFVKTSISEFPALAFFLSSTFGAGGDDFDMF